LEPFSSSELSNSMGTAAWGRGGPPTRSVGSRCDRSESASNSIRSVYAVSIKERLPSPAKGGPFCEKSDRERLRILCTIVRRGHPGWSPVSESKERSRVCNWDCLS
jgi:hypothetical protein